MTKTTRLLLLLSWMLLGTGHSWAAPLSEKEQFEGVNLEISMPDAAPGMGKNPVTVKLTDDSGNAVGDAEVKVYYKMPPMQGMHPMNYRTIAEAAGDHYTADLDLTMKGAWEVTVKFKTASGAKGKKEFSIDVQ